LSLETLPIGAETPSRYLRWRLTEVERKTAHYRVDHQVKVEIEYGGLNFELTFN
jgi:hypothetical protein